MNLPLNISKFLIIPLLMHTFLSINLFGQNWFPLEIGNRWDFSYSAWCHGGFPSYDTISVEVLGDTILNNKEYFVLSRFFPIAAYERYLRVENDSLYCFRNSSDCLMYALNKIVGTKYYACRLDSVLFFNELNYVIFSYPDTVQQHNALDFYAWQPTSLKSYFSKKFGVCSIYAHDPICDGSFYLSGCIISGITYGQLLVSVEHENNSTASFKLKQNFPNPFNTSSKIEYTVVENGLLTLKVFDVLGREVVSLVNDEKPPGEYEVEFNGYNFPGGVYFYQMKAGNFVETKKMILLK